MLACRPMLCFALAVMAGVVAARYCPEYFRYVHFGWLSFFVLVGWFILTPRSGAPSSVDLPEGYDGHIFPRPGFLARRGLNRFILIACLGFFLVAAWRQNAWHQNRDPQHLPGRWFTADLVALGPCREHPGERGDWRVPALLLSADGKDMRRYPVRLSGPEGADFRRGDIIQCRVRRDDFRVRPFPGAFDFRFWLERGGLAASLAVTKPRRAGSDSPLYTVVSLPDLPLFTRAKRVIDAVRAQAIALTLEHGGGHGGVLAVMLYGYRKDLDGEIRDSFRRVGIGHVLAISGLHVGLIVGLLWWASGWLNWSSRWRAVACLILAVVYLGLSGGQVAASRATLMAVIHLGGIACGRKSDMLNSLGAAAFFLVLANPSAPLDVSFQLSFTAVVFIYLALDRKPGDKSFVMTGASPVRRRIMRELWSLVRLSVSTWVGLFPIIALVFNQVNPVGLPINIVVIPLMSLVLAGGLLLPCLGWLPGGAWLSTFPTWLLTKTALLSDALPYSSFPVNAPAPLWIALFYLFAFSLLLRGMIADARRKRVWTRVAVVGAGLTFAGLLASMASEPAPAGGRISIIPGHGFGVVAVESEDGGMALLGTFARSGWNETGWLHYLRRSGEIGVVALGDAETGDLATLAYHYPIGKMTRIGMIDKSAIVSPRWLPVDGVSGVEYAVSRDYRGRVVWLAARTGNKMVCVAPRLAVRQFVWRMERKTPGAEAGLMVIGFNDSSPRMPITPKPDGKVAIIGRYEGILPSGWFERRRYGVLVLDGELRGFDGTDWRNVGAGGD